MYIINNILKILKLIIFKNTLLYRNMWKASLVYSSIQILVCKISFRKNIHIINKIYCLNIENGAEKLNLEDEISCTLERYVELPE